MLFRQLFDRQSCTYTYLLAADYGQKALLIDPVLEQIPLYNQLLKELDLQLVNVLDTHLHADHITASGTLRQQHGCEIIMGEQTEAQGVTHKLKDGEILDMDGIRLTALYTPGHTADSYSFYLKNPDKNHDKNDRVFTGDTLLIRATGRTDFQSGSAQQQYNSLVNKLLLLPESTLVYPAHDYKVITVSTIGEEKQHNPRLQIHSVTEYVDIMNHLNLPPPQMLDIAVAANLYCGLPKPPSGDPSCQNQC